MDLKLTFLGTGTSQGVPVIGCDCEVCLSADKHDKRLRSSVLIDVDGVQVLIDAGPDFRQQMLNANVNRLDGILLTHEHKDHMGGLDDVRALNYITGRPVDIYAEARVQKALQHEYQYAFSKNKYPGVPEFNLITIENKAFEIAEIPVMPIRVYHHLLPIFGFRIGNVAYITDASHIDATEKKKLTNLDILVLNVIRRAPHISHFSLSDALALGEELKPKRLYLTHLSHQIERYTELVASLSPNVVPAYDGLILLSTF